MKPKMRPSKMTDRARAVTCHASSQVRSGEAFTFGLGLRGFAFLMAASMG